MIRKRLGNIEWLEFELLAGLKNLRHGVFLRHGGVSTGNYASLNVLVWHGDDAAKVEENKKRVAGVLAVEALVSGRHVHGNKSEVVTDQTGEIPDCDALITKTRNVGLLAPHADCQVAIMYDPLNHALATVHAGWRGQVQKIYQETVGKMRKTFGSKPEELLVGISPSLGPENSEFKNFKTELPEEFLPFQIRPTYFNLWEIARYQLEGCGILPHHLEIAKIDTYANPEDFFSYRRSRSSGLTQHITGCHATAAVLT
jgi:YfiH family protein